MHVSPSPIRVVCWSCEYPQEACLDPWRINTEGDSLNVHCRKCGQGQWVMLSRKRKAEAQKIIARTTENEANRLAMERIENVRARLIALFSELKEIADTENSDAVHHIWCAVREIQPVLTSLSTKVSRQKITSDTPTLKWQVLQ